MTSRLALTNGRLTSQEISYTVQNSLVHMDKWIHVAPMSEDILSAVSQSVDLIQAARFVVIPLDH